MANLTESQIKVLGGYYSSKFNVWDHMGIYMRQSQNMVIRESILYTKP